MVLMLLPGLTGSLFSCQKDKNNLPLKGTSWKLVGIVDVEAGVMKELEPKDCAWCFTLTFETSNITCSKYSEFTGNSGNQFLWGCYEIDYSTRTFQIFGIGMNLPTGVPDSHFFSRPFMNRWIHSFSHRKKELKLYFTPEPKLVYVDPSSNEQEYYNCEYYSVNKKYYLLFKPL